jgi:hypothetical protein
MYSWNKQTNIVYFVAIYTNEKTLEIWNEKSRPNLTKQERPTRRLPPRGSRFQLRGRQQAKLALDPPAHSGVTESKQFANNWAGQESRGNLPIHSLRKQWVRGQSEPGPKEWGQDGGKCTVSLVKLTLTMMMMMMIIIIIIFLPTQEPKGQLQSEQEWKKGNKRTQRQNKAK